MHADSNNANNAFPAPGPDMYARRADRVPTPDEEKRSRKRKKEAIYTLAKTEEIRGISKMGPLNMLLRRNRVLREWEPLVACGRNTMWCGIGVVDVCLGR